jgi:hypothetical protein
MRGDKASRPAGFVISEALIFDNNKNNRNTIIKAEPIFDF